MIAVVNVDSSYFLLGTSKNSPFAVWMTLLTQIIKKASLEIAYYVFIKISPFYITQGKKRGTALAVP